MKLFKLNKSDVDSSVVVIGIIAALDVVRMVFRDGIMRTVSNPVGILFAAIAVSFVLVGFGAVKVKTWTKCKMMFGTILIVGAATAIVTARMMFESTELISYTVPFYTVIYIMCAGLIILSLLGLYESKKKFKGLED